MPLMTANEIVIRFLDNYEADEQVVFSAWSERDLLEFVELFHVTALWQPEDTRTVLQELGAWLDEDGAINRWEIEDAVYVRAQLMNYEPTTQARED